MQCHMTRRCVSTTGRPSSPRCLHSHRGCQVGATSPTSRRWVRGSAPAYACSLDDGAPADAVEREPGDERAEHTPRWSADGELLAFVSADCDTDRVWVSAWSTGSAPSTTSVGEGCRVEDLEWIDDGCLAAIVAPRSNDTAVGQGSLRGAPGGGSGGAHRDRSAPGGHHRRPHQPCRVPRHGDAHGVGDVPDRPPAVRGDRLGRPERVRVVRVSALAPRRRSAVNTSSTARRGRSPPHGSLPTGHEPSSSRDGRATAGSSPARR